MTAIEHDAASHAPEMIRLLDVDRLRANVRDLFDWTPDDSHGGGYRNSGVQSALRVIEEMAGRSFDGRCQPSANPYHTRGVWCLTHGGPMTGRSLWCPFADRPWEWRDEQAAEYARLQQQPKEQP